MNCVYLGSKHGRFYDCHFHGKCNLTPGRRHIVNCETCNDRLLLDAKDFLSKWLDPLHLVDATKSPTTALRGLLRGRSVFLAAGGPSTNEMPLERLNERGAWTMGVNNMAGHPRFRAQAMICSDPPLKFSHCIWRDPCMMKFIPIPKMSGRRANLKEKLPNGDFQMTDEKCCEMPNVWGFQRHSWMMPDNQFFLTNGACWGNHNAGVKKTGQPKTVCTMLLAIRMLRYLGAKRVFLLGVDFRMVSGQVYSFVQKKGVGGVASNNGQFEIINRWLCTMVESGTFKRFGMEIYNCYQNSALRAFPYVPFNDAIALATEGIQDKPDLEGWYEKTVTAKDKDK